MSAKGLRLGGEVHEKPSNKSLLRAEQKPNCLGIRCAKEEKKVAASVHWYSQNAISLVDREVLEHIDPPSLMDLKLIVKVSTSS